MSHDPRWALVDCQEMLGKNAHSLRQQSAACLPVQVQSLVMLLTWLRCRARGLKNREGGFERWRERLDDPCSEAISETLLSLVSVKLRRLINQCQTVYSTRSTRSQVRVQSLVNTIIDQDVDISQEISLARRRQRFASYTVPFNLSPRSMDSDRALHLGA